MIWKLMKKEVNKTLTENGALTLKSSESKVLDLFAMGGALRTRSPVEIEKFLSQALAEDKTLAIKCLFYLRDIRGGQGERRTFREGLKILSNYYPAETSKLLSLIPEYGRWDDIFYLDNIAIDAFLKEEITKSNSLLFKWLPSENAGNKSKELARKIRKYLGLSSKKYRKLLSEKRKSLKLVETNLTNKNYDKIVYSQVPAKASMRYKKAFSKHDGSRYAKFISDVKEGKVKINAKTLFPYEIVREARKESNETLEVLWRSLPDYTGNNEKAIVVADVSGSMSTNNSLPMDISVSLAMYFAERNKGVFQNKFITFSGSPELQEIKGVNLNQKIFNLERASWEMNTNLQAVFELLLNTAVKNTVPEEDMPKTIYIISDMEFDSCTENSTNFDDIKQKYETAGYKIPQLVFWNVNSKQNNVPVSQNENGVILVSGASPSTFKMVCEKTNPYQFMLKVLNSERYKRIDELLSN
jgi:hypothetical protein